MCPMCGELNADKDTTQKHNTEDEGLDVSKMGATLNRELSSIRTKCYIFVLYVIID